MPKRSRSAYNSGQGGAAKRARSEAKKKSYGRGPGQYKLKESLPVSLSNVSFPQIDAAPNRAEWHLLSGIAEGNSSVTRLGLTVRAHSIVGKMCIMPDPTSINCRYRVAIVRFKTKVNLDLENSGSADSQIDNVWRDNTAVSAYKNSRESEYQILWDYLGAFSSQANTNPKVLNINVPVNRLIKYNSSSATYTGISKGAIYLVFWNAGVTVTDAPDMFCSLRLKYTDA